MTDEQIITELNISNASDEVKSGAVEDVRGVVDIRVGAIVSESFNDDQAHRFAELEQLNNRQAVWDFLRDEIVGIDMSEVYDAVLRDYLDEVKGKFNDLA